MTELRSLSLLLIGTAACSASEPVERSTDRPADAAGTWTTAAAVPDARTEVSVTTDGERIWLIGGFAPRPVAATRSRRAPCTSTIPAPMRGPRRIPFPKA